MLQSSDLCQNTELKVVKHICVTLTFVCIISLKNVFQHSCTNKARNAQVHFISEVCKEWYFNWTKLLIECCLVALLCLQVYTVVDFLCKKEVAILN